MVAVFTVPDDPVTGRPDPLAEQATSDRLPVLKYSRWRKKKVSIPEVLLASCLFLCSHPPPLFTHFPLIDFLGNALYRRPLVLSKNFMNGTLPLITLPSPPLFCLPALKHTHTHTHTRTHAHTHTHTHTQVLEEYKSFGADLNVLPFCTQFIPMDVINFPKHGSIIYHPSLLPRHRGASAINWSAICKI